MLPSSYIEKGWTRRTMARAANGEPVEPTDPAAAFWCVSGALRAARILGEISDEQRSSIVREIRRNVRRKVGRRVVLIPAWNDMPTTTQSEALDVVREAERLVLTTTDDALPETN